MTQSAIDQVQVYKDEYMLDDTTGNKVGNAAALYKVIMRCTTIDTLSTNKALRDKIKDLPNIAATLNGDIDAVHSYFFDAYHQLKACGADVDDKEEILFATYDRNLDSKFRSYMSKKAEDYITIKKGIWPARTSITSSKRARRSSINSKAILTVGHSICQRAESHCPSSRIE